VSEHREGDGNDQERNGEQKRGQAVSIAEGPGRQLPRLLDQRVDVGIARRPEARHFRAREIQSRPTPPCSPVSASQRELLDRS
jgi:hypothetical protein